MSRFDPVVWHELGTEGLVAGVSSGEVGQLREQIPAPVFGEPARSA